MKPRCKIILKLSAAAVVLVVVIAAMHLIAGLTMRHSVRYVEISYASPKITPELDGYVIAFITDIHDYFDPRFVKIRDEVASRGPDLVLLGGDFAADPTEHLAILHGLNPPGGIYGVGGNHDDPKVLYPAMRAVDMTPLHNEGVSPHAGLFLAGAPDLRTQHPDTAKAFANAPPDAFVLLLSHNPALVMEHDVARADLALAGHTHGGQINFFGLWSPALSVLNPYGNKFRTGWVQGPNNLNIYVSNGIGSKNNLLRIFAVRQVIFLTLHSQAN